MKYAWVIFDADNTLWDIEFLYIDARNKLCLFLQERGCSYEEVNEYQRKRDKELFKIYNYSACRFARSFEDTVIKYLGIDCEDEIIHMRSVALQVFELEPKYTDNLEKIFDKLKDKYQIALITAGEKWVQDKRVDAFHLKHDLSVIEVVEKKSKEVFDKFIKKYSVDKSVSWVVGDSINSDVKPGIESGLNTIWYDNTNWAENENHINKEIIVSGYKKVSKLEDILGIIL